MIYLYLLQESSIHQNNTQRGSGKALFEWKVAGAAFPTKRKTFIKTVCLIFHAEQINLLQYIA